jgi:hypothetical protein
MPSVVGDVRLGGNEGLSGYDDDALARAAVSINRQEAVEFRRHIRADDCESAVIQLKDVRTGSVAQAPTGRWLGPETSHKTRHYNLLEGSAAPLSVIN